MCWNKPHPNAKRKNLFSRRGWSNSSATASSTTTRSQRTRMALRYSQIFDTSGTLFRSRQFEINPKSYGTRLSVLKRKLQTDHGDQSVSTSHNSILNLSYPFHTEAAAVQQHGSPTVGCACMSITCTCCWNSRRDHLIICVLCKVIWFFWISLEEIGSQWLGKNWPLNMGVFKENDTRANAKQQCEREWLRAWTKPFGNKDTS